MRMRASHAISAVEADAIVRAPIQPGSMSLAVDAGPFVVYAQQRAQALGFTEPVQRTIDGDGWSFSYRAQDGIHSRTRVILTGIRPGDAAIRLPAQNLHAVAREADRRMYEAKRRRSRSR